MEFFEIKRPIRRIGTNTYIIGDDINNPLVTISDNEINAPTFNITSGVFIDGIDISSELKEIKTSFITNRYELSEAFEHDENGDVVPTTGAQISDTMWILRNENDLEPRANIWRYNTGPQAFTEDISF